VRRSALFPDALSDRSREGSFGQPPGYSAMGSWLRQGGRAGSMPGDPIVIPRSATAPPPITLTCTSSVHRVNGERGGIMGWLRGYGDKFSADCCKGLVGLIDFGWEG
jgi:hypothetical protein